MARPKTFNYKKLLKTDSLTRLLFANEVFLDEVENSIFTCQRSLNEVRELRKEIREDEDMDDSTRAEMLRDTSVTLVSYEETITSFRQTRACAIENLAESRKLIAHMELSLIHI